MSPTSIPSPATDGIAPVRALQRPLAKLLLWWSGTACTAAFLAAVLAGLRLPPYNLEVWALRTLLLVLPIIGVAIAMAALYPLRRRVGATTQGLGVGSVVGISLLIVGGCAAIWTTKYEYPYSLVSRRGISVVGLFLVLDVVVAAAGALMATRSSSLQRIGAPRIGMVASLVLTLLFNYLGYILDPSPFWPLRYSNSIVIGVLILGTATLARGVGWSGRRVALTGIGTTVLAALLCATASPAGRHQAYATVLANNGNARRMLMVLRRVFHIQGTHRSPLAAVALSDGNAGASNTGINNPTNKEINNPTNTRINNGGNNNTGNDRPGGAAPSAGECARVMHPDGEPPALNLPPVRRVLVATIDTFRCELDGDRLCDDLDRLAQTASYHGEQRVFMAQTPRSLGALFGAPYVETFEEARDVPSYIAERARAADYRTDAIYNLNFLDWVSLAGRFEQRDDSLGKGLSLPDLLETVFSGRITDRTIADLEAHRDDTRKSLLWVHYLDPHETYVPTAEGEPVPYFRFDRRNAYKIEVRRTQAAVTRLVERARKLGYDRDAAIIITGDHGENFHYGHLSHGITALGEDLDVPVYAWIADAQGKLLPIPLPAHIYERDVSALIAAVIGAPRPPLQSEISVVDARDDDLQFVATDGKYDLIFHKQLEYEELFDRKADPAREHNLAFELPDELARMRLRMACELYPFESKPTVAAAPQGTASR